jgi:hypothetical protein
MGGIDFCQGQMIKMSMIFRTCHNVFCLVCRPLQNLKYWIYGIKVLGTPLWNTFETWGISLRSCGEHGGNKILRRIMPPDPSQKEIR